MDKFELKEGSFRKIILDNGIFRKLVKSNTSQAEVKGILDFINSMLPVRLVATFGLWSEYVGLSRPALRNLNGYPPFRDLKSIEVLNDVLRSTIGNLIDSYRNDPALQPTNLEATVSAFISRRVSSRIEEAKNIAVDIVHFEGQDFNGKTFSWAALANQLAIEFATDELFYLIRFMPTDLVDAVGVFTRQMAGTLKEFKHLPMYRLAESIVKYIWRVHDESPDATSVAMSAV